MPRRLLFALALLAAPACKSSLPANVCADTPPPHCVTKLECSLDETRGCQVCRCAPPPYQRPEQTPPR